MHITIDGFTGGITVPNAESGTELAMTLMVEGYVVKVNGLRVRMYYGPGYDLVEWAEGDFEGQPLNPAK